MKEFAQRAELGLPVDGRAWVVELDRERDDKHQRAERQPDERERRSRSALRYTDRHSA